ncbi:hypothetical protein MRS44_007465 [Fusarium solani]|uniref:uncharacterized protein n=1 Tax=Fusarium solani TaxID=169388 RepID=UPI0032C3EF76|nr:hypothetical protein MRS44_007465 [Fusarium solani]
MRPRLGDEAEHQQPAQITTLHAQPSPAQVLQVGITRIFIKVAELLFLSNEISCRPDQPRARVPRARNPPVSLSKLPRFDRPITRRANRERLQSIRNCPLTTPAPSTRNALPLYISNVMLDETLDVGSVRLVPPFCTLLRPLTHSLI